jgi:hypothetical protein
VASLPVLISFARSGGTLVNQLLGVHPDCLVLSEVNPAGSCKPVADQAVEWLGLVAADEGDAFRGWPYRRQIAALEQRAAGRGKRLVVRDWVTINFLRGASAESVAPSGQLEQLIYLEAAGLAAKPVVVARRAREVHRSIRRSFRHMADLPLEDFADAYSAYARDVAGFPIVHLEQLRARPAESAARLLTILDLPPTDVERLLARFPSFDRCTGNNTLAVESASAGADRVLPPEPDADWGAASDPRLAEADALLGYGR